MGHTFLSEVRRLEDGTHQSNIPNPQTPHEPEGDVSDTSSAQDSTSENSESQKNCSKEASAASRHDSCPDDNLPSTEPLTDADCEALPTVELVQTSASINETVRDATVQDELGIGQDVTVVASSQYELLSDNNPSSNGSSKLNAAESEASESTLQKEKRTGSFNTVDVAYAEAVSVEVIESTATESSSTETKSTAMPRIETVDAKAILSDNVSHETSVVSETTVFVQNELTKKLALVNAELDVTQQREDSLKGRVKDLEAQLCEHKDLVEQLRLDLEIIKTSKKELLEELAEAKRYILHLTEQHTAKQSSTQTQLSTHQKTTSQSRETSSKNAAPGQLFKVRSDRPSNRAVALSPPRPVAPASPRPSGLPPMSTEHLQGKPLKKPTPNSKTTSTSKVSSPKPGGIQRSPHRPFVRLDRPIPDVARDTHTKVPTPKLSDSDISWFD